jgi:hypothetical protein
MGHVPWTCELTSAESLGAAGGDKKYQAVFVKAL